MIEYGSDSIEWVFQATEMSDTKIEREKEQTTEIDGDRNR